MMRSVEKTPIERGFELFELNMAALEWPGEGLPVIALHGWLDNAASFIPLAPWLQGVHLLAPDLIGHGQSDHLPPAANYHLADSCRWVAALADAMGWQRFVLLGHSMGAGAASITAAALPQRVAGLILIDGIGPISLSPEQEIKRLRQGFEQTSRTGSGRGFADLDSAVLVRQRLGRFAIGHDAARLIIQRGMKRTTDGYRWTHDERLSTPGTHYYSAEQAMAVLRAIEMPSLLISGEQGAFQGWDGLAERIACIEQLEHCVLAGGHHLHMEEAEAVGAKINAFLGKL